MRSLRDDSGNVATSLVLALMIVLVLTGIATSSFGLANTVTTSSQVARLDLAADNFISTTVESLNHGTSLPTELCDDELNACVKLVNTTADATGMNVKITGKTTRGREIQSTQTVRLVKVKASYVAGFNSVGKPSWVRDTAAGDLTMYDLTEINDIPTATPSPTATPTSTPTTTSTSIPTP